MADSKKPAADSEITERSEADTVDETEHPGGAPAEVEAAKTETDGGPDTATQETGTSDASPAQGDDGVADEVRAEDVSTGETPHDEDAEDVPDLAANDTDGSEREESDRAEMTAAAEEPADLTASEAEADSDAPITTTDSNAKEESETGDTEKPAMTPVAAAETVVVERRGAFVPGFLGGAIAAAGVIFASPYVIPAKYIPMNPEIRATLDAQSAAIASLRDEATKSETRIDTLQSSLSEAATASALGELKDTSDAAISALRADADKIGSRIEDLAKTLDAAKADSSAALKDLSDRFDTVNSQVVELEKRPIAEATDPASVAAVEAYNREMAELRTTVAAQMAKAEDLVKSSSDAAAASVQKAIDAANAAVAEAENAAKAAEAKAAAEAAAAAEKARQAAHAQTLVDIQTSLEDGSPFADTLAELGSDAPAGLSAVAADGVATLAELRTTFTADARKALAVARSEVSDGSMTSRTKTWIQNQLGVRSLTPSAGDDPDAVLSRAEADLAEGRLMDAVKELDALPEGGKKIMAGWVARATARAEALAAADALAGSPATN